MKIGIEGRVQEREVVYVSMVSARCGVRAGLIQLDDRGLF
jgi:hypothetical protein